MKIKILNLILMMTLIYSCSSDDSAESSINLLGTKWINIDVTQEKDYFTFISETEYLYTEERLGSEKGTYTFNGATGVMNETSSNIEIDFEIKDNILYTKEPYKNSYRKQ
jgi:hypothetical protein